MLNIAICTREFRPHTNFGGMATFYDNLSDSLAFNGVHVEIFTQGIANETINLESGVVVHYITVNRLIYKSKLHGNSRKCFSHFCFSLGRRFRATLLQRRKKIKFDFIEVHEHMGIGAALQDLGIPINTTVHTPLYFILRKFPKTIPNLKKKTVEKILNLERRAISGSNSVIFLSDDMRKEVSKDIEFTHMSNIQKMYNPCDIPEEIHYEAFKQKLVRILYFGRLEERKGVHLLPNILSIFKQKGIGLELNIAGEDSNYKDDSMFAYIKNQLSVLDLKIRYYGKLSKVDLGNLILENSIVIVPSLYDNSAFAAQEAMAYGRMVLCSDKGGTSEYVGTNGLTFDPMSKKSITDMVDQFEKADHLKMGRAAREFSIKNFSKSSYANQYLKIVNNAVG